MEQPATRSKLLKSTQLVYTEQKSTYFHKLDDEIGESLFSFFFFAFFFFFLIFPSCLSLFTFLIFPFSVTQSPILSKKKKRQNRMSVMGKKALFGDENNQDNAILPIIKKNKTGSQVFFLSFFLYFFPLPFPFPLFYFFFFFSIPLSFLRSPLLLSPPPSLLITQIPAQRKEGRTRARPCPQGRQTRREGCRRGRAGPR